MADLTKNQFEYRMSKKVAELTQVVHMLFKRNHEKEVQLDATNAAYEDEIDHVLIDAKDKIVSLKSDIANLKEKNENDLVRLKNAGYTQNSEREDDLTTQLHQTKDMLQEEKNESQNLRDLLIRAQEDLETLRNGMSQQISSQNVELVQRELKLETYRKQTLALERKLGDQEQQHTYNVKLMEKNKLALTKQVSSISELLEESHKTRDVLNEKNRHLENDLRKLRKDFGKKVSNIVHNQNYTQNSVTFLGDVTTTPTRHDTNDELDRLRQEVHRYRMELSNRDRNFNRMFSDQKPVMIDPRAGKIGLQQLQVLQPQQRASKFQTLADKYRKSVSSVNGQSYDIGLDQNTMSPRTLSAKSTQKLPTLSPEKLHSGVSRDSRIKSSCSGF